MRVRLASLVPTALLLLGALGLAAPVQAGPGKVDLSPFFADPIVGDFKVFSTSTGDVRRSEVLEIVPWKKGWSILVRHESSEIGVQLERNYTIPGKFDLLGSVIQGDAAFLLAKPKKIADHQLKPGRPKRYTANGKAYLQGMEVGKARFVRVLELVGFEPLDTPVDSYPVTARIDGFEVFSVQVRAARQVITAVVEQSAWYAEGLGLVATTEHAYTFVNGTLVEDDGVVESWFVSGVVGGVPVP
jgi:hypothetical protein